MSIPILIDGILERKLFIIWQSRRFCLLQDGSFLRYKGNQLRSTAIVQPDTTVTPVGVDEFSLTGLTEDGRSGRDYLLRASSTALRDDWVSKFEVTILFTKTKTSKTQLSPHQLDAPIKNADDGHSVTPQLPQDSAVIIASEGQVLQPAPSIIIPHVFASPFSFGILASRLLQCSSLGLPVTTRDLIDDLRSDESQGSNMLRQLQQSGAFVERPTVMVCHSPDAVWKETIDAICSFCGSLKDGLDTVVWIEALCVDHTQSPTLPSASEMRDAITRMDHVLMVATPWQSPLVLTFASSLWMIYCALSGPSKKLSIILTESQRSIFADTVSDHTPFIRFRDFSCRNMLQSSAADSFHESIDREGYSNVDVCVVRAMDKWFISCLEDAISAAEAQNDAKQKVRIQQVLSRLLLDTEQYDSSSWKILDQSQSESKTDNVSPIATSASQEAVLAPSGSNAHRHNHRHSAVELEAIESSKRDLEVQLISSFAERLGDVVTKAKACEKALIDAVAQATSDVHANVSKGHNDSANTSQSKSSASPVASAPIPTRKVVGLSVSSSASKSALDVEDDSAFDETKTPDAPILKYGRNGVPELRQLILSDDKRFLSWKGKKGGQGSVDMFQLKDILLGQQTETFKLLPSAGLAVVSFSLVLDDRTLDCVAKSVRERRWWCAHILHVHKMLRPQGARAIAESLGRQLQGGKFDSLNDASKTQLHTLFLELMNGREEEKIRNHRKHAALFKYTSVLDIAAQQSANPRLTAPRACVDALKGICTQQAVVFLDACAAIAPEVQAIGKFCVTMIEEQVKLFTMVYLEGKELASDDVIACLLRMTDSRDKVLACDNDESDQNPTLRSHFVMLSSAAPAFCWVSHPGLPAELVTDVLNALPVFGQRLEALGPRHVEFFNMLKAILRSILHIMNQYHADGVAWSIETVTCTVVTNRFRSQTDENKIFQTDVDFLGIHNDFLLGPVARLVEASKFFTEYVQKQILLCKLAFIEQKNIIALSRQYLPPRTPAQWEKVLHNMNMVQCHKFAIRNSAQASIEEMSDNADARSESQDSILALRLVAGAMGCVSWLTIDLNPHLFLTDVLSGLSVYGEKLLALDDASGRCSEFYGATLDLVAKLATLVKTNHSHGLIWNPRGEDFVVEPMSCTAEEDSVADL